MTTTSAAALVLLCGCSFSGKSTAAALLDDGLGAEVVSLDAINAERGLDGGQGIPVEEWARTNDEARARTPCCGPGWRRTGPVGGAAT